MKILSGLGVAGAVSIAIVLSNGALAQECEPSRWGPDDEIGAANYVTPERVLAATKLVNEGQSHPLGIVVDPKMPVFPPFVKGAIKSTTLSPVSKTSTRVDCSANSGAVRWIG